MTVKNVGQFSERRHIQFVHVKNCVQKWFIIFVGLKSLTFTIHRNTHTQTNTPITKKECFVLSVWTAFIYFETRFRLLYKGIHSMARCLLFISAFFLDSSKIRKKSMRQIISNYTIHNKELFSSFVHLLILKISK